MFERFTTDAREIVLRAREQAKDLHHEKVGTEHLLLALTEDQGAAGAILRGAGLDVQRVRADVQRLVTPAEAILDADDVAALRSVGIDVDAVMARIEETFGPDALHQQSGPESLGDAIRRQQSGRRGWFSRARQAGGSISFGPRAKKVLELSLREAMRLKSREIASGHLLLGLLREGDGLAAKIIVDAGADLATLRTQTEQALRAAA